MKVLCDYLQKPRKLRWGMCVLLVLRSEHLAESQPLLALIRYPWNVFEGCEAQPNTSSESEQGMRTEHMLQEANHLLQFKRPSHIQRKKCLPQW